MIKKKTWQDFLEAPLVGSFEEVARGALKFAELKENEHFCDLGCGDGRVVYMAAMEFGSYAHGVDINPHMIEKWTALRSKIQDGKIKDKIQFIYGSFRDIKLSEFDVIYMYLKGITYDRLIPKLAEEVKDDTRIIAILSEMSWYGRTIHVPVHNDDRTYLDSIPVHLYVMDRRKRDYKELMAPILGRNVTPETVLRRII